MMSGEDDSVIQLASSCTDQNVTPNNQRCDQPCEKNVLKSTATSRHPDGFKANELKPDKRTIGSEHKLSPIQNISGNRMLRSSVRPFLCCGSQLSLNSVSEFIELETTVSEKEIEDTEFTDLSDCDEVTDLMSHAKLHDAKPSKSNLKLQDIKASQKKMQSGPAKSNVRRRFWTLKLKGKLTIPKRPKSEDEIKLQQGCVCKAYTRKSSFELETDNDRAEASAMYEGPESSHSRNRPSAAANCRSSVGNLSPRTMQELFLTLRPINFDELGRPINFDELYPTEDIDERRIAQRRKEMEEGIDVPDIWVPQNVRLGGATGGTSLDSSEEEEDYGTPIIATFEPRNNGEDSLYGECSFPMIPVNMLPGNRFIPTRAHSTVDYIHCLVPDILEITKCSFYWGVMDRYQAEKLLENKPEGTFLLRDSAQDDYLFSVSFRRYGRSLHARIEQWNHKFSFDSHDPGVFASDTVCGLIDHYKDPTCCMFFEPMLTIPLHRNFPFSLQHLCRATISNHVNYDSVGLLPLPKTLRQYMRFYHYKQKIRMRRLDTHI